MAGMSIRGLDDRTLARLKRQAEREGSSLNSLVLRLLQGTVTDKQSGALQKFDDLDALAGTWSRKEAQAFERNTVAFSEVDAALWK
jgi:phosphopantetheinyl transferase (holo-ACP synthase)